MPRLYVPLPNEVSYCYAYDQPISFGNTSQGALKVEWMGGMEATLRRLAAVGVQAIPWGSVGADLLERCAMRCSGRWVWKWAVWGGYRGEPG